MARPELAHASVIRAPRLLEREVRYRRFDFSRLEAEVGVAVAEVGREDLIQVVRLVSKPLRDLFHREALPLHSKSAFP